MPLLTEKELEAIAILAVKRIFHDKYNARGLSERAINFAIREAVRLTAERCAAICEEECNSSCSDPFILGRASCAAAIREAAKS